MRDLCQGMEPGSKGPVRCRNSYGPGWPGQGQRGKFITLSGMRKIE